MSEIAKLIRTNDDGTRVIEYQGVQYTLEKNVPVNINELRFVPDE